MWERGPCVFGAFYVVSTSFYDFSKIIYDYRCADMVIVMLMK